MPRQWLFRLLHKRLQTVHHPKMQLLAPKHSVKLQCLIIICAKLRKTSESLSCLNVKRDLLDSQFHIFAVPSSWTIYIQIYFHQMPTYFTKWLMTKKFTRCSKDATKIFRITNIKTSSLMSKKWLRNYRSIWHGEKTCNRSLSASVMFLKDTAKKWFFLNLSHIFHSLISRHIFFILSNSTRNNFWLLQLVVLSCLLAVCTNAWLHRKG